MRYDRLLVGRGDRLLDLGAGGGRHAFEAMRRGACVVAVDADGAAAKDCGALMAALDDTDDAVRASGGAGAATVGDALELPFPDATFDRVIASEVLEHVPEDRHAIAELVRVLRPGGTMAVTVPRWFPELVCWVLSDDYHLVPGGHVRIYRRRSLLDRLQAAGLRPYGAHHAHSLHTPYWWLKCAVGVGDDQHRLVKAYHRLLVWDITAGRGVSRVPDRLLNPVIGKSLVVYLEKPGGQRAAGGGGRAFCVDSSFCGATDTDTDTVSPSSQKTQSSQKAGLSGRSGLPGLPGQRDVGAA